MLPQILNHLTCYSCNKAVNIIVSEGGCGCATIQRPPVNEANSPCADCKGCDDSTETDCIFYSGADIPQLGIKNGDKLTKIIILFASEILAIKAQL